MRNNIVSKAYAKSLYELGKEQNVPVTEQLTTLNEVINANNNFENVLFMDVFTMDEKISVVEAIVLRLNLDQLIKSFVIFLIGEKRIHLFPIIFKDIVCIDDHEKGFLRGILEGSEEKMNPLFQKKVKSYLEKKLNKKVHLEYEQREGVLAGCRATVEDFQIDVSLDRQLDRLNNRVH